MATDEPTPFWYAVRTKPGAQVPYRERWPEPTVSAVKRQKSRGKGYSIASSVNPEKSVIEAALEAKGIAYYMPAEFAVVRNRNHRGLYELRRFALLKGYIFVGQLRDKDWPELMDIRWIHGVVANNGRPVVINNFDMLKLRLFEKNLRSSAIAEAKAKSRKEEIVERRSRKAAVSNTKKKLFPGKPVRLIWGSKVGREATVQSWTDQDQVQVLVSSLDAAQEVVTVPYEFLKAAS